MNTKQDFINLARDRIKELISRLNGGRYHTCTAKKVHCGQCPSHKWRSYNIGPGEACRDLEQWKKWLRLNGNIQLEFDFEEKS